MKQFVIDKNIGLSTQYLTKILTEFQSWQQAEFRKRYNYYDGKQQILMKKASDIGKPCNRIVCNFVKNIVQTYEGYALGLPVIYESSAKGFENLQEILRYNDYVDEDAEFFRSGLIEGRSAEICYVDEDGQPRFKVISAQNIIPVYDNTLNGDLLYAIRVWQENPVEKDTSVYYVEVYDSLTKKLYTAGPGFSSFTLIGEELHHFSQVPVTFFSLNDEEDAIAQTVFTLQDAYNTLYSDSVDNWESFCDAYLVLKGVSAEEDDLKAMKEHRVLMMDADASADYLVKNTSMTEIQDLLKRTEEKIRELTACPNFASETFGTSSGIAIKYRCMAMENNTAAMLSNFKKALQKRIELLADIIKIVNGEELWRDIEIKFRRNLPVDEQAQYSTLNSLRGLVSDATLLSQISFIENVDDELEKKAAEKEVSNNSSYSSLFNMIGNVNEE